MPAAKPDGQSPTPETHTAEGENPHLLTVLGQLISQVLLGSLYTYFGVYKPTLPTHIHTLTHTSKRIDCEEMVVFLYV